jgi:hypothetical protein
MSDAPEELAAATEDFALGRQRAGDEDLAPAL